MAEEKIITMSNGEEYAIDFAKGLYISPIKLGILNDPKFDAIIDIINIDTASIKDTLKNEENEKVANALLAMAYTDLVNELIRAGLVKPENEIERSY